jgi:hypothetical protein
MRCHPEDSEAKPEDPIEATLKLSPRDPSTSLGMTNGENEKAESKIRSGFLKYYPADAV